MADNKEILIREIENDIEDIYCERIHDAFPYDIFLGKTVKDAKGEIYRLDINADRTIWALENDEDFTLTLDELEESSLTEIEETLSNGNYTIGH